jgi:hypothetical protein
VWATGQDRFRSFQQTIVPVRISLTISVTIARRFLEPFIQWQQVKIASKKWQRKMIIRFYLSEVVLFWLCSSQNHLVNKVTEETSQARARSPVCFVMSERCPKSMKFLHSSFPPCPEPALQHVKPSSAITGSIPEENLGAE